MDDTLEGVQNAAARMPHVYTHRTARRGSHTLDGDWHCLSHRIHTNHPITLAARGSRILTILKEILAEQRSIRRMIEFIMMHEGIVYEEETVLPREE